MFVRRTTTNLLVRRSAPVQIPKFQSVKLSCAAVPSSFGKRTFATDESGFHDDFKAIKKQYEQERNADVQEFIKKVSN
jgi:hypothetical protein